MSLRRKVGELLRLRFFINLVPNGTTLFVRCIITGPQGQVLNTVNLQELSPSLFGENDLTMPNESSISAQFQVYSDAQYTNYIGEQYPDGFDIYEIDSFDPSILNRNDQIIVGVIKSKNISAIIKSGQQILGVAPSVKKVMATVSGGQITAKIKTKQFIEGVIND